MKQAARLLLRHVDLLWLGLDHVIDARFLLEKKEAISIIAFKSNFQAHLVLVNVLGKLGLAQLVESDDDEGHEDVDEEEGEDDKVDDVEDGNLGPKPWDRTLVLVR